MASRRMFNISFVNGDDFLDLDTDQRCLYFGLLSQADDDGFVESARGLCRAWGLDTQLLRKLEELGYLISFGSIYLIVHWPMHNHVPKDRYRATVHADLASQVTINANNIYERLGGVENTAKSSENTLYTQNRIGQIREEKFSVDQDAAAAATDGTDETGRKIFWAAMKMIQISHGVLVCRQDICDMDMDIDRQLPRELVVTPQLNQLRYQLAAISGRLLEGSATPHDKGRYRTIYEQLVRLAGGTPPAAPPAIPWKGT